MAGKKVDPSSVQMTKDECSCLRIHCYLIWLTLARMSDVGALTTQRSGFDVERPLVHWVRVPMLAFTKSLGAMSIR